MKPPNTLHRLRTHFVAGLLVVVPGAVSIWVVVKLFDLVTASIPAIAGVIGFGQDGRDDNRHAHRRRL